MDVFFVLVRLCFFFLYMCASLFHMTRCYVEVSERVADDLLYVSFRRSDPLGVVW